MRIASFTKLAYSAEKEGRRNIKYRVIQKELYNFESV
jgi:hypothetical protein